MALLRPAARALRLRSVEGSSPRLLSSSVPTERRKCFPTSDPRSRDTAELERSAYEKKEDILQCLSTKVDKITDGLDKHSRLLKELELQMKNNNKSREIDLTPAAVVISASFLSFVLYKYVPG